MFSNRFNTKNDPVVGAIEEAMKDGALRRQAEALVNEEFGVYNRNALVREDLAAYDARLEEAYKCMKEGKPLDPVGREDKDIDNDGDHDKSDKYLLNRRKTIGRAMGKRMEEEQIDEINQSKEKRYDSIIKAFKTAPGQVGGQSTRERDAAITKHMGGDVHKGEIRRAMKRHFHTKGLMEGETDYSAPDRPALTKSAPKEDPSTPKSYPGAASSLTAGNPTSQRMSNAVKSKLEEAVSRKHFQQVADLIKGHESQEKRNELASHHAGIFAKQNPRFNAAKFHAAAGSTAHQEPKKMEEAVYSAKAARAGKDIGKPGKSFAKIAKKAAERYGSEKRGKKVAGAVLAKIRAKHMKEAVIPASALKPGQSLRDYMNAQKGLTRRDAPTSTPAPKPTVTPGTQGVATGKSFDAIDKARNAAADKAATASIKQSVAGTDYAKTTTPTKVASSTPAPQPGAPKDDASAGVKKLMAMSESVQVGENKYRIV